MICFISSRSPVAWLPAQDISPEDQLPDIFFCVVQGESFSLGLMIVALKDWEEVQNRICQSHFCRNVLVNQMRTTGI